GCGVAFGLYWLLATKSKWKMTPLKEGEAAEAEATA
ncbi:MAG: hypothetical protein QOJ95_1665, partial [Mycobacterium sp.]|nr:hypothetical protein [Mycobacterium sp.]